MNCLERCSSYLRHPSQATHIVPMSVFITLSFHISVDLLQEVRTFVIGQIVINNLKTVTLFFEQITDLARPIDDIRGSTNFAGEASREIPSTELEGEEHRGLRRRSVSYRSDQRLTNDHRRWDGQSETSEIQCSAFSRTFSVRCWSARFIHFGNIFLGEFQNSSFKSADRRKTHGTDIALAETFLFRLWTWFVFVVRILLEEITQ